MHMGVLVLLTSSLSFWATDADIAAPAAIYIYMISNHISSDHSDSEICESSD